MCNPIARVVKMLGRRVVPDKRAAAQESVTGAWWTDEQLAQIRRGDSDDR
jgi:hypothetical protein